MFDAIVFDFDGLILDTETPLYEAWRQTFEHHRVDPISLLDWSHALGRSDDDPLALRPLALLEAQLGRPLDEVEVQALRRRLRDQLLDRQPIQPGVEALLDEAQRLGVPVAIASSSPLAWIQQHLGPRGLLDRFAVVSCAGDGVPGKPDPATYLFACERLGVEPSCSVALEDSPHGVRAAKAAGLFCVAVPTPVGLGLDFAHADLVVSSVADFSLNAVG